MVEGVSTSLDPARFGRVALLMGGWSAERAISLKSGEAVLAALRRLGVDVRPIDAGRDVLEVLEKGRFDRAFIILHGRGGEDGVIQGGLELLGIPYTGSGVLGSALGMDKLRCKAIWGADGLPTPRYRRVTPDEGPREALGDLRLPVAVKPAHEGSSIGVSRVDREAEMEGALAEAFRYDDEVLVEEWIEGAEYSVSLLEGRALPAVGLKPARPFYDYAAKYESDDTCYLCPCGLPEGQEEELGRLALAAFEAIGASGWGRVDFMVDGEGRPWLIEVNTVPGMTDHSLVPMAAAAAGIGFDELVGRILATSLEEV
ncbi:MAG TPA: D-alanine--D-alanine ligase [Thiotrichales bacterium]|nr:D-alanine--D-alanine ligase [Thiotrichales bacterium]